MRWLANHPLCVRTGPRHVHHRRRGRREPDLLREVLPGALPWMRCLPAADLDAMAAEPIATTEAAAVSQLLVEWRHAAESSWPPRGR